MKKNIQLYSASSHQKAWIAILENQIIGCVAIGIIDHFHEPCSVLRVIAMIVDQDHRRNGIGKRLMSVAEEYAHTMNCSYIELSSSTYRKKLGSHDFYRTLGYEELNEQKKFFGKKIEV
jgi:GNAT superfamily N-acetyltransferase